MRYTKLQKIIIIIVIIIIVIIIIIIIVIINYIIIIIIIINIIQKGSFWLPGGSPLAIPMHYKSLSSLLFVGHFVMSTEEGDICLKRIDLTTTRNCRGG